MNRSSWMSVIAKLDAGVAVMLPNMTRDGSNG